MLTKAIIMSPVVDGNKYLVRIPIFESAGNSDTITSTNEPLYEATLCYVPGDTNSYREGDVVFVSFENNELSDVVILGKLWLGEEEQPISTITAAKLHVSGNTELDGTVKVNGVTLSTINEHTQAIDNLVGISGESQSDIKVLKEEVDSINKKIKFKDWVIEESGDNLNIYRLFNSEVK